MKISVGPPRLAIQSISPIPRWVPLGAMVGAVLSLTVSVAAPAVAQSEKRLDDFTKTYGENEAGKGWSFDKIPFTSDDGIQFRFVHDNGGQDHFIHMKSGSENSYLIGRDDFEFEVEDWPILEWEWRVTILPKDGDVRVEERDDQAGSICLVIDPGMFGADETLCYIWENKGPKEAQLTSTKREESKYIILRAGDTDPLGEWQKESRNMLEDFKRVFGYAPDDEAIIGMQIDSDSTSISAEVFYRNIYLKKP